MSNSASPNFSFDYTFGSISKPIANETYTYTPLAAGNWETYWAVPTTETAITSFPGITTQNYLFMFNTDASNYCQVNIKNGTIPSGSYAIRLLAGQMAVLPIEPGSTLYAKANTATVNLDVRMFNA